ncbi:hypothetical protein [Prosthecochloris sp. GSB1]|uniref:hypothetical protein n=1 Tax=Prosthecochloris sp. GSB1 TaxID=281093 RepID=UPI0012375FE2|nr:hypothetical protein [Prosthecochloris sp. GSB1]
MPAERKHSVSRSFWRFFEIALFFLVSVLGYNFLAKTTSVNAKSKSREHSERGIPVKSFFPGEAVAKFFFQDTTSPSRRNRGITEIRGNTLSPGGMTASTVFSTAQGFRARPETQHLPRSVFSIPAFNPDLFQQKRVLII